MISKEKEVRKEVLILTNMYLGEVEGEGIFISQVRDKNNEILYLPRVVRGKEDWAGRNVVSSFLTGEQRTRLNFCLRDLNLSILPAVDLALNKTTDGLRDKISKVSSFRKMFIAFEGPPLSGKTAALAAISNLHKKTLISTDVFSKQTLYEYQGAMLGARDGLSGEMFKDRLRFAIYESSMMMERNHEVSVKRSLDLILHLALRNEGLSVVLVDTPGMDLKSREVDVFDVLSFQSLDGVYKLPKFNDWEEMYDFVVRFPEKEFVDFVKHRQRVREKIINLMVL